MAQPAQAADRLTYLIVDGENIDATLGNTILGGRRPAPEERPRWERVRGFAEDVWQQPVRGLFFLNASSGQLPLPFVQALIALDYRPIPLQGRPGQKVVDIGIQRTLAAIEERPGDVLLASHDSDFLPHVSRLLTAERRVALVGFRECMSTGYADLAEQGLETFDLEDDVNCFTRVLPRVRIIPIDLFDPAAFL